MDTLFEDRDFTASDLAGQPLSKVEYDHCTFSGCDLSNSDLSGTVFTGCTFTACNLSLARLIKSAFRETRFHNCKMLGLHFEECEELLFSVGFTSCQLNLSSFYARRLKKASFIQCSLQEVDFTDADLSGASLAGCDLSQAVFDNTILEGTDLRGSMNYTIDPQRNRIRKAKFSANGVAGLLNGFGIVIE
jgi:fluoroquinolone resistance protein